MWKFFLKGNRMLKGKSINILWEQFTLREVFFLLFFPFYVILRRWECASTLPINYLILLQGKMEKKKFLEKNFLHKEAAGNIRKSVFQFFQKFWCLGIIFIIQRAQNPLQTAASLNFSISSWPPKQTRFIENERC